MQETYVRSSTERSRAEPGGPSRFFGDLTRRAVDVIGALAGIILFSPLFLMIAWLIKRDSPGPTFYRGKRLGKGGREFQILKFRTMYERPETYQGPPITAQDDARVTSIGHWLRDTKLNELPQFWNVLKGEMSLVGPRPEAPEIVAAWPPAVRNELLSVRPGVTSPASVIYRDEESMLRRSSVVDEYLRGILPTKLRLDQLYVRNRSLLTDLDVLFLTTMALLPRLRRMAFPEHILYWGPFARFFSRHLSWFLIDIPVAFLAVGISGLIWRTGGPLHLGIDHALMVALGIAFLFSLLNALLGINRIAWSRAMASDVFDLAFSSGLVTATLLVANWTVGDIIRLPPGMLLVVGLLAFLGFVSVRFRSRLLTGVASRWLRLRGSTGLVGERVLIVGGGEVGLFAAWLLRTGQLAGAFSIVGVVDDDPRKQGMRIDGCEVLGQTADIPALIKEYDVGVVLFAIANIQSHRRRELIAECRAASIQVVDVPDVLDLLRSHFSTAGKPHNGRGGDFLRDNGNNRLLPTNSVLAWLQELEWLARGEDWEAVRTRLDQLQTALGRVVERSSGD